MSTDIVRGELERLFSLDELMALSSDLLGLDPEQVGGTASKASYARSLTERCLEIGALEALIDAVLASREDPNPKLENLIKARAAALDEPQAGATFGPFELTRKIAEGPRAVVFAAKDGSETRTVKIYRRAHASDAIATQRLLAHNRLIGRVEHENLASTASAGIADHRAFVAYPTIEGGQPLAARIGRTGPLHLNEAKKLLLGVLSALRTLHSKKLVHGGIKTENIIVGRAADGSPMPILVDPGTHWLTPPPGADATLSRHHSPELMRGEMPTARADLFAFGVLLYEVLTGKSAQQAKTIAQLIGERLQPASLVPSEDAPRGWVSKELDKIVSQLLSHDPRGRAAAETSLESLLEPQKPKDDKAVDDSEVDDCVDLLIASPDDPEAALALEAIVERGADPIKAADAFTMAADQVEDGDSDEDKARAVETKKALLYRAARIFEHAKEQERAEDVYALLVGLDRRDEIAALALEQLRLSLGKHEEVIEMLLERGENAENHTERARALHKIGQIYVKELDDKEQAVFAFAQALAQEVQNDEYALDLERTAGSDMKLWAEALQTLNSVSDHPRMPDETKVVLYMRLGHWYSDKTARPDLGLPCFQAVLAIDPAHEAALEGLTNVYRRAQQWQELGQVLLRRADRAATPAQARDHRAEAADLLETRLNDSGRARDLYEQIFNEDPGHPKACEALARIYQRLGDHAGYAKLLEQQAEALRGDARIETLCRIAELYEDELGDLEEAQRRFEAVLAIDPQSLNALKGLDRVFNRLGRYKELLTNLEKQIQLAATPRQRINLYERIAGIHDEEFLDHEKAAGALESILKIDDAHEGSLSALVRHYRALKRWEEVVSLYDRSLAIVTEDARRVELLLASGRVLVEQVGSPERARAVYEKVLEIDPNHGGALEALANVRAQTGDAAAALSAVESLAAKATANDQKADLWVRAAKLLADKGDRDGAIERYKAALEAQPDHAVALGEIKSAYLDRGDVSSAIALIEKTAEAADSNLQKARAFGEIAQLSYVRLKDSDKAEECARKAIDLDASNLLGWLVTGDIAFDRERFLEAATAFGNIATRTDALPKEDALRTLSRYVDSLSRSGSTEKAIGTIQAMLDMAPDNAETMVRAARVYLDANQAKEAVKLYDQAVVRFGKQLEGAERADVLLHQGLARLRAGNPDAAIEPLNEAADLAPDASEPIDALCEVYEAKEDWEKVVKIKTRRLDVVTGDKRSELLLSIGEILADKIKDRTRAAKSFVAALDEKPDDRRILTKLMQLYSEEKDWSKLVDIVLRLAEKVDLPAQKAKYLHTAAIVTGRQMGDVDRALEFYDSVLELDPSLEKALTEATDLRLEKGDYEGVEQLVKVRLERATEAGDTSVMLQAFEQLGTLYRDKLGWTSEAIDAFEAAQTLDPDNSERNDALAALYASDPEEYLEKAVASQMVHIHRNPFKPDGYRALRKLYTETKMADAAWCLCQALAVMHLAEPDEERFYRRLRAEGPAEAVESLTDQYWNEHLMHEDADPLLTAIFTIIEPAVLRKNGQALETLGYQAAYALDLARHPYPMSQTLYYAAGALGTNLPTCFQNPEDPGGLSFLHASTPAIVLGAAALAADVPTQAAAYIAGRHLTYYRPGLFIRHLVATGTGLRAWLFAAIKLVQPSFPVASELEGPVGENHAVLTEALTGGQRDQLTSVVTKLLQAGAIDLKRWVAGIDLSADRAGLLLCNDLEIAQEMIRAADESSSTVPHKERLRQALLFSVSDDYLVLRRRLGINVDG